MYGFQLSVCVQNKLGSVSRSPLKQYHFAPVANWFGFNQWGLIALCFRLLRAQGCNTQNCSSLISYSRRRAAAEYTHRDTVHLMVIFFTPFWVLFFLKVACLWIQKSSHNMFPVFGCCWGLLNKTIYFNITARFNFFFFFTVMRCKKLNNIAMHLSTNSKQTLWSCSSSVKLFTHNVCSRHWIIHTTNAFVFQEKKQPLRCSMQGFVIMSCSSSLNLRGWCWSTEASSSVTPIVEFLHLFINTSRKNFDLTSQHRMQRHYVNIVLCNIMLEDKNDFKQT